MTEVRKSKPAIGYPPEEGCYLHENVCGYITCSSGCVRFDKAGKISRRLENVFKSIKYTEAKG